MRSTQSKFSQAMQQQQQSQQSHHNDSHGPGFRQIISNKDIGGVLPNVRQGTVTQQAAQSILDNSQMSPMQKV